MAGADGPVTLNVVAAHAGVSRQTVSNALNAPGRLRPETLRRVHESIAALGYRPDRHARSLRTRSASALGLAVSPVADAAPPERREELCRLLPALAQAVAGSGRSLLVFAAPAGRAGLPVYRDLLDQGAVDGFVLAGTEPGDPRHSWLAGREVSFSSVGRTWTAAQPGAWVDTDYAAGAEAVVHHLHARGHRRIALLACPPRPGPAEEAASGWRRACQALGLPTDGAVVAREPDGIDGGLAGATRLLARALRPTALVAVSDALAVGAVHALVALGLRPGADVAVTGFGDTALCVAVRPALTTVRFPVEELAQRAVRLLDGAHAALPEAASGVLLAPRLVVRGSG